MAEVATARPQFARFRHNDIAGRAQRLLDKTVEKKVLDLLKDAGVKSMNEIGDWADAMKSRSAPKPGDDKHTVQFLADPRNKAHASWHFVNLPLDASEYSLDLGPKFTSDTDVVQMLAECVRVLEKRSTRFSEPNALRLLSHLVADAHQPLHVGCSYIDKSMTPPELVRDPERIRQDDLPSDRGGNNIILPGGDKLHELFDGDIFSGIILDPKRVAPSQGLPESWGRQWATRSLAEARRIYDGLRPTELTTDGKRVRVDFVGDKEIYIQAMKAMITTQAELATGNLAALLNEIYK